MDEKNNAVQGKTDPVEVRASEIAQREGRSCVSDEDLKRAYTELREMSAPPVGTKSEGS